MISVRADGVRFDLRAAAVILDGPRVLLHRPEAGTSWSLPGGRVHGGEAAADAVVREMAEELGEPVLVERHLWTIENFFAWQGEQVHEVGLYFQCRPWPGSRLLARAGPYQGREGDQPLRFDWFDRFALAGLDLLPEALEPLLADWELVTCHRLVKAARHAE